jgi:disulfide bond formation protein DsbB
MKVLTKNNLVLFTLVQAVVATLGSLYFSEIAHFVPCVLCWYQRICMYPLIVILFGGYLEKNSRIYEYVLPLSVTGWLIAVYQNLLVYNVIPQSDFSCRIGLSCSIGYINWLGFITIPLLSLAAFTVINTCMILLWRNKK